jgi:hypothetical protein
MSQPDNRPSSVVAAILIGLGLLFLAFNFLDIDLGRVWPLIFFVIGAGFYMPALLRPQARAGLAVLFVPGTIMLGLGVIFMYNTLTDDWGSWAYAWSLIPAFVGLGLVFASRLGRWHGDSARAGLWLAIGSATVFSVLAMFFGSRTFGTIGPVLLIGLGVWLLFRTRRVPAA